MINHITKKLLLLFHTLYLHHYLPTTTMAKSILITVVVLLGLCSFSAFAGLDKQLDVALHYNIFKDWSSQFNKKYGIEEMAVRYYNWKSNLDFVQEHNSKDEDAKLEMNSFADLSPEEFSALHLGLNIHQNLTKPLNSLQSTDGANSTDESDDLEFFDDESFAESDNSTANIGTLLGAKKKNINGGKYGLPKSVDWRKTGAVTGVKNQGRCGGCWSFAASGALEGLHAIKKKKLVSFSEQQMIDCASAYGNQGCDGGLMTAAFQYTSDHGIEPENGYSYTAKVGNCQQNPKKVVFRNKGFKEVPANNHEALKAAVAKQPVSIGIEASSMTLQLFKSGVITANCGTNLDHGVLVVGYDKTPKGQEYWIVKNSWGSQWGLGGYFHIAMGSQNNGAGVCGINMMASYPTA